MLRVDTYSSISDRDRDEVYQWLRDHNARENPAFVAAMERGVSKPIALIARSAEGAIIGGLIGETLLQWLRVHVVAVSPGVRRTGIGTRLMQDAEQEARARGCTLAYVDTMSYQSPTFYRRLGYAAVGEIQNWDSHGHAKHFFTKCL